MLHIETPSEGEKTKTEGRLLSSCSELEVSYVSSVLNLLSSVMKSVDFSENYTSFRSLLEAETVLSLLNVLMMRRADVKQTLNLSDTFKLKLHGFFIAVGWMNVDIVLFFVLFSNSLHVRVLAESPCFLSERLVKKGFCR